MAIGREIGRTRLWCGSDRIHRIFVSRNFLSDLSTGGVGKGSREALLVGVVIQAERPWPRCCASRSLYEEELPAVALILLRAGAYRVSCWLELARSRPGRRPHGGDHE